jgi:hypothetical protein
VVRDQKEVLVRIGNCKTYHRSTHRKKIYVESEFGVGSEFSFTLANKQEISRKG